MPQRFHFGTLRFVELYREEEKESRQGYDSYLRAFDVAKRVEKNFIVIGSINGMSPLLQLSNDSSGPVFIFDERQFELVRLANLKSELTQILGWIEECWNDHKAEMFLPRNPETIEQYRQFIEKIKSVPGIDPGYWIDFAFKELDIRYEM
jgi:hypothetical protein